MNIFSYYLVLTKRSNSNFDMSSKCLPKLTWASRKPFPSDKLRTTFGQPSDTFCPVQNGIWQLGGPVFPRKPGWGHGCRGRVGVWSLTLGGFGFQIASEIILCSVLLKTLRSRKVSEALTEAWRKQKWFPNILVKIVIRVFLKLTIYIYICIPGIYIYYI